MIINKQRYENKGTKKTIVKILGQGFVSSNKFPFTEMYNIYTLPIMVVL